uniref:Uncharacterized protein n=1 Tax=Branchiostoma floridae TaxID=7739 RepID=C3YJZ6_BRAFL|eukprot:XP_002603442.1 hypothetical protein BRAFLDRAFT_80417 [Branchiostoma floridae]
MHEEHLIEQYIRDGVNNIGAAELLRGELCSEATAAQCNAEDFRGIIQFVIRAEAIVTAKMGSYSGLLQTSFLAGFAEHIIIMFCEDPRLEWYHDRPMSGCGCRNFDLDGHGEVKVMLVRKTSQLNHFVGLIKSSGRETRQSGRDVPARGRKGELPGTEAASSCAAKCILGCTTKSFWEDQPMIECEVCHSCLMTNLDDDDGNRATLVLLGLQDVVSIRPGYWITGGLMDMFGKHLSYHHDEMQPQMDNMPPVIKIMSTTFVQQVQRDMQRGNIESPDVQGAKLVIIPVCRYMSAVTGCGSDIQVKNVKNHEEFTEVLTVPDDMQNIGLYMRKEIRDTLFYYFKFRKPKPSFDL